MKRLLLLAALLAAAAFSGGVGRSQATFVASSNHANQTFGASPAFNGVAVALSDPGTPLRSTVPLSATASSDRPLVSVTFQRSPAGAGTWTTICAPTAAPYTCSWNSAGVADGLYDLRATALDASGYTRTSTVSSRRVDNTAPATGVTAATPLTGTATVSATATDAGSGVISVAFEARPSSGGSWTPICTDGSSPYSCSWDTTAVADGAWDVRATATDGAGNTSSATTANRIVDNTAPDDHAHEPGHPARRHGHARLDDRRRRRLGRDLGGLPVPDEPGRGLDGGLLVLDRAVLVQLGDPGHGHLRPARDRHRRRGQARRPRRSSRPAWSTTPCRRRRDAPTPARRCAAP